MNCAKPWRDFKTNLGQRAIKVHLDTATGPRAVLGSQKPLAKSGCPALRMPA